MNSHKAGLIIDPEFSGLIPPLTQEEREQLERNLLADGCLDSLVVWHDTLVDGHNRYEICQKHGIEFNVTNINLRARDDVIAWIILHQLGRRNLSDFVRVELALRIKPILVAKAEAREKAGYPSQNSDEGRTDQKIADAAHVSRDTVRKVEAIKKHGADALVTAARAEEISINKAAAVAKKPKSEQAKALKEAKEPKPKKAKAKPVKPEDDDCSVAELGKALEASDIEVRSLQALVESLKKDDLSKELAKLHTKYAQLEGRLGLAIKQKNEADKQAKYSTGMLAKIRAALKVQTNGEILQAIRNS